MVTVNLINTPTLYLDFSFIVSSSSRLATFLGVIPSTPLKIGTIITFILHDFLSFMVRSIDF